MKLKELILFRIVSLIVLKQLIKDREWRSIPLFFEVVKEVETGKRPLDWSFD